MTLNRTSKALFLIGAALLLAGCAMPAARQTAPAPTAPPLTTGLFRYMADAPGITLCADGRRMAVAMEGDYLALERAYTSLPRRVPGAEVLVTLDADVQPRPSAEPGLPPRPTLVVRRFDGVWPGESCPSPQAWTPLRNTYWKATRLSGRPVVVFEGGTEPHFVLELGELRVAGSAGCNRFMGTFLIEGDSLAFGRLSTSRMACPLGMGQERVFLDTLEKAAFWKTDGRHLDLFDSQRNALARFEAVALR
jgi:copper homeostasis protein (lipoprotein)